LNLKYIKVYRGEVKNFAIPNNGELTGRHSGENPGQFIDHCFDAPRAL